MLLGAKAPARIEHERRGERNEVAAGSGCEVESSSGSVPDGFEHAESPFSYRLHLAYPNCFALRVSKDDAESNWKSGDILIVEATTTAPIGALAIVNGMLVRNETNIGVTGRVVSMIRRHPEAA